jgi:hypothetical protein
MTHQESVDALKSFLRSAGSEFAMGWLAEYAPWTQLPIVRSIIQAIVGKFIEDLLDKSEFEIFSEYIELRVNSQGIAFEDAMLANYQGQQNPQLTQEQKDALKKILMEKFAAFGSVNG